jgi:hypothetical protein
MIVIAGGIIIAVFALLFMAMVASAFGRFFRFLGRHKPYVYGMLGALALWTALSVAGSYDQSPAYQALARQVQYSQH